MSPHLPVFIISTILSSPIFRVALVQFPSAPKFLIDMFTYLGKIIFMKTNENRGIRSESDAPVSSKTYGGRTMTFLDAPFTSTAFPPFVCGLFCFFFLSFSGGRVRLGG